MEVTNADALKACFDGEWPSFHDAEVYGLRLDSGQRTDGQARLELDVHVFAVDRPLPAGRLNFTTHTLVTFGFEGVEQVELGDFGTQNVLDDLLLEAANHAAGQHVQVTLPSNNGLSGSFRCRGVEVIRVSPFEPGPHSVYRG